MPKYGNLHLDTAKVEIFDFRFNKSKDEINSCQGITAYLSENFCQDELKNVFLHLMPKYGNLDLNKTKFKLFEFSFQKIKI